MVILKESDTQHHFKNIFFKMYKKWQETKLIDLLQVDLPRHMKSDEGLFWKSTKLAVFELKMLLFTMMTEELNWELPPEPRGILEHRTWRLRFLGPASFLCKLENETKSREPAHTTDKLLRLSEKGNTCPSWLSAREVYART